MTQKRKIRTIWTKGKVVSKARKEPGVTLAICLDRNVREDRPALVALGILGHYERT
jgi:hypothetical protein